MTDTQGTFTPLSDVELLDLRKRIAEGGSFTEEELERGIQTIRADRAAAATASGGKKAKVPAKALSESELENLLGI